MFVIVIHNEAVSGRILGCWKAFEDAQDYAIDNYMDDEWYVYPIDIVNDDRAPRIPYYGGTRIDVVKVKGDLL